MIYMYLYIIMKTIYKNKVVTTEGLFEVAIEGWSE